MGLFRGLTVILIGFVAIGLLKKTEYVEKVPLIGGILSDNLEKYRQEILVVIIAFVFLLI